MRRWLFGAVFLVAVAAAGLVLHADSIAQEDAEFPDLTLYPAGDEEPIQLLSLRGRPVLLSFWASWCGPCRWELPEFEELHEELADRGFVLVTINVDRNFMAADMFLARTGLRVPVYRLHPDELYQLGVNSLPTNILIDSEGKVALTSKGYTATLKETIRGHVVKMLDKLDSDEGESI